MLVAVIDLLRTGDRLRARAATEAIWCALARSKPRHRADSTWWSARSTPPTSLPCSGFQFRVWRNPIAYYYWRTLLFEFWRPAAARAAADSLIRAAKTLIAERQTIRACTRRRDGSRPSRDSPIQPRTRPAGRWSWRRSPMTPLPGAAPPTSRGHVRPLGDYDTADRSARAVAEGPSWISIPVLQPTRSGASAKPPRCERLLRGDTGDRRRWSGGSMRQGHELNCSDLRSSAIRDGTCPSSRSRLRSRGASTDSRSGGRSRLPRFVPYVVPCSRRLERMHAVGERIIEVELRRELVATRG